MDAIGADIHYEVDEGWDNVPSQNNINSKWSDIAKNYKREQELKKLKESKKPDEPKKSKTSAFIATLCFIALGGYVDVATNDMFIEASNEHSDPSVVEKYENRLSILEQAAEKRQEYNAGYLANLDDTNTTPYQIELLNKQYKLAGQDFMESVWNDNYISEQDVETLSTKFEQSVMPISRLGFFNTVHPKYLDECKAENPRMNGLVPLQSCTIDKHIDEVEDGPWLGLLVAMAIFPLQSISVKLNPKPQENNKSPKKSMIDRAMRRIRGKPTTKW